MIRAIWTIHVRAGRRTIVPIAEINPQRRGSLTCNLAEVTYQSRVVKRGPTPNGLSDTDRGVRTASPYFDDLHTLALTIGVAVLSLWMLLLHTPSGAALNAEQIILMPYWGS